MRQSEIVDDRAEHGERSPTFAQIAVNCAHSNAVFDRNPLSGLLVAASTAEGAAPKAV
jgi:hypothetical protein